MFLIYVNKIGSDWVGTNLYEFLFSDTLEDIDGEEWDCFPALNNPSPPHKNLVKLVGRLSTEIKLSVIQESDAFSVWDSVDGVVSLAWEYILDYEEYPEDRIAFPFGITKALVDEKLYARDLKLEYINHEEK
jgi:hypothetical protein